MAVQPDPDRKRGIGVGLPERTTPFGIPQIEIEVVDKPHLPAPLHVRVRRVLLTLRLPRPPHRRLLLGDPDQHHPTLAALAGCLGDQRRRDLLLVLALREIHHRDALDPREPVYLGHVGSADLPESRRRGDLVSTLPAQEPTHPTHRLQLRHIGLQKDPVNRTTGERDVIAQ
jgi:hypothetical protein